MTARLEELRADAFLASHLPNVRYLTGFSGSNGQVLLTPEAGLLLTDGRYAEQSRREVPDLERRVYTGEFAPALALACRDLGVNALAFEARAVSYAGWQELSAAGLDLVPSTEVVERLRWVKDDRERKLLEAAQAIADATFEWVLGRLEEGIAERQLALSIEVEMRRRGADGIAFDSIVAFGEGSAEPHHAPTEKGLSRGDVVKLDFGCVVAGYHSDMTRTLSFGEPPGEMREAYRAVQSAQQAGADACRAGMTGGELDLVVRSVIEEAGLGEHFRHGLGHGVGLEIHEGPSLRAGSRDVLPEGAVVTIEPGVYLEGVGGVRIEDMVEVGVGGCRIVPRVPKDLIVL